MLRKIFIGLNLLLFINHSCNAMEDAQQKYARAQERIKARRAQEAQALPVQRLDQLPVVQEINVARRVTAFNEWKKDPQIEQRLNTDEPGTVQAYIHLSMMMHEPEEKAKSPAYIAHATQFAQAVCPSYKFWPEYYQAFSRCQRGKCYSNEEQVEVALAPKMQEINRLKEKIAALKGEEESIDAIFDQMFDWKKETELLKLQMKEGDDWKLLSVIKRAIPAKQAEIERLNQEVARLSQPAVLQRTLTAKVTELTQTRVQLADLQTEANTKQRTLQAKTAELTQLKEHVSQVAQNLAQLQESRNHIKSMLALFEASKSTGWEASFIEAVKAELGK